MRIIGLYGHSNCGKSATLNILKDILRKEGKSISSQPHPSCDTPETFEYRDLIVCVAPGGDTKDIVENNVGYFKSKNCDIAISATRCRGGSVEALEQYAINEGVNIVWVRKSYEYNLCEGTQNQCNKEIAQYIIQQL